MEKIRFVFDGPPGPECGRFVEVENEKGESISIGEWVEEGKFWYLEFPDLRTASAELLEALEVTLEALECWKAECPDSWDVGDADAVATATRIIRKHKGK